MAAASLTQSCYSAVAATTSPCQRFFDRSSLRCSSLALTRRQTSTSQAQTTPPLPRSPTKRNAPGVARLSLKQILTRQDKQEVKATMEFYIHEIRSADPADASATLKLAGLPVNTAPPHSSFVFDNEVREGARADSKLLGRERGWGCVTDRSCEEALQLHSKFSFTGGEYEGSSITVSGNVGGAKTPYELIVHGGRGFFRGAQGY